MPAPEAGSNTSTTNPDLSVVPPAEQEGAPRSPLNRAVEAECSKAEDMATKARRDEYKLKLEQLTIDEAFCTALTDDIKIVRRHNRAGVDADAAGKDATYTEGSAEATLLTSLHGIQAAARLKHLPDHPGLLDGYLIGQKLDGSQESLKSAAQSLIDKANEERPPGMNTEVIERITGERAKVVKQQETQDDESGKGKEARQLRDDLVKNIIARRKKIQYAADQAFPYNNPANTKARSDFKLPPNRPYSY
jgi:hypothetical protein